MEGPTSVLSQLIKAYASKGESMIAVNAVPDHETSNYGVVDANDHGLERSAKIRGIVEKPAADHAPSNLALVGRYVLDGEIMEILKQQKPGRGGEIQLTDAIEVLAQQTGVYAFQYQSRRFDCGSKIGYLEATMTFGPRHPEYGPILREKLTLKNDEV